MDLMSAVAILFSAQKKKHMRELSLNFTFEHTHAQLRGNTAYQQIDLNVQSFAGKHRSQKYTIVIHLQKHKK